METTIDRKRSHGLATHRFHDEGGQARTTVHAETPVDRFVGERLSLEEDLGERREVVKGEGDEGRRSEVLDADRFHGAVEAIEGVQLREHHIVGGLVMTAVGGLLVAVVAPRSFIHNLAIAIKLDALPVPLPAAPKHSNSPFTRIPSKTMLLFESHNVPSPHGCPL